MKVTDWVKVLGAPALPNYPDAFTSKAQRRRLMPLLRQAQQGCALEGLMCVAMYRSEMTGSDWCRGPEFAMDYCAVLSGVRDEVAELDADDLRVFRLHVDEMWRRTAPRANERAERELAEAHGS